MSYSIFDFSESVLGAGIGEDTIVKVEAAWGEHGDYAEWEGGFLLKMKDDSWIYLSGWCDTTGWGCQDGTDIAKFNEKPILSELKEKVEWETDPQDCMLYLKGEIDKYA